MTKTYRLSALLFALLLVFAGCAVEPEGEDEDEADEETAEASSALVFDEYIPDDGPSAPPLVVSWVTSIGSAAQLSSLTYKVRNTSGTLRNFTLKARSFGLDHRVVTRTLGSFELSPGAQTQQTIQLQNIPIKSVSHSSELSIELTTTHDGKTLTMMSTRTAASRSTRRTAPSTS